MIYSTVYLFRIVRLIDQYAHRHARAQEGGGIYYIPVAAMCCTVKKGDLALLLYTGHIPAKNAFVHVLTSLLYMGAHAEYLGNNV